MSEGLRPWFWTTRNEEEGWRLDVVTLLAVIGESAIAENALTITATPFCLIPRIIPAPQALLKAFRPPRLPSVAARMVGVHSGIVLDSVGFFANILHPLDELPSYGLKVLEITHADLSNTAKHSANLPTARERLRNSRTSVASIRHLLNAITGTSDASPATLINPGMPGGPRNQESTVGDATADPSSKDQANSISVNAAALRSPSNGRTSTVCFATHPGKDVEAQDSAPTSTMTRSLTFKEKVTDYLSSPTVARTAKRPAVPAQPFSPIHILSVFSFFLTVAGIGLSAHWKDGTAMVALGTISSACSVVGYANWWKPILMSRPHVNVVPRGDVVIRTRQGAFLIVKCNEDVARELYSGAEECHYRVKDNPYRALMGAGTLLLMLGVVLLGNCSWNMQVFIGGSYMLLNGFYWAMNMLPRSLFWDLSRYKCVDITPKDARHGHETTDPDDKREGIPSFTRTMWFAIRETKKTAWCLKSGAAPDTEQWEQWLKEAGEAARRGDRRWRAVARKGELMRKQRDMELGDGSNAGIPASYDPLEVSGDGFANEVPEGQQAPAVQVSSDGGMIRKSDTTF